MNTVDENDVIRYLMEEMDPSEEVLMERAMMEDDDLLIEVESMRQTLHRLDDLPEKTPPAELSESIVKQADEHKTVANSWPAISTNIYKYAAVLIIGIGMGSGMWYFMGISGQHATLQKVTYTVTSTQITASNQVKPWIDQDNILYFQDKFGNVSGYQAIQQTSLHKLTPVKGPMPMQNSSARGGVHLTSEIK